MNTKLDRLFVGNVKTEFDGILKTFGARADIIFGARAAMEIMFYRFA